MSNETVASNVIDMESETANMFGIQPCPKCGSEFRVPIFGPKRESIIRCDDCRFEEPEAPPKAGVTPETPRWAWEGGDRFSIGGRMYTGAEAMELLDRYEQQDRMKTREINLIVPENKALEAKVTHLEAALRKAHDKLDDSNAGYGSIKNGPACQWCKHPVPGYDGNGLLHSPDCILVEIRQLGVLEEAP